MAYVFRKLQLFKFFASGKGFIPYRRDAFGQNDTCQITASAECLFADRGDSFRYNHASEAITKLEYVFGYGGQRAGKGYAV